MLIGDKKMLRYILVSLSSGVLFGIMDGIINANPVAQRLYSVFEPIARKSINVAAGIVIDIVYGFAMAGIFLFLHKSLPGESGLIKGLAFGILIWFFRVFMQAASQWMMYNISVKTLIYSLTCGLFEMLVLGLLYGLTLRSTA